MLVSGSSVSRKSAYILYLALCDTRADVHNYVVYSGRTSFIQGTNWDSQAQLHPHYCEFCSTGITVVVNVAEKFSIIIEVSGCLNIKQ